ncbi:MAG: di-heme enzyme [Longimicrobiales bacterium]|nr:di-heme enzyme [Longimicrobiales bacterium]
MAGKVDRNRGIGLEAWVDTKTAAAIAAVTILVGACEGYGPAGPGGSGGSGGSGGDTTTEEFAWNLPDGFPEPRVPEDNPMTEAKVELGRRLFYDQRLSGNGTQSCASCHQQDLAFTDGRAVGIGSTGEAHPRASMSLTNIGYQPVLTWMNPDEESLAHQTLTPLFGTEPVELGMASESELMSRVQGDDLYRSLFAEAFPDQDNRFTVDNVSRALASFQRTLISGNSPEDRFRRGDESALSESAKLGRELFFSERPLASGDSVGCFRCHGGTFFTGTFDYADKAVAEIQFDNNALYNIDIDGDGEGDGAYPEPNQGLIVHTGNPEHMGRFKVPTLRNIALTAPYMHDGSIANLDEVLDHYAAGGRTIESGPNAGDGSQSPLKSEFITGFTITAEERQAVIDYLHALTDQDFIEDERLSNPWPPEHPASGG